MPRLTIEYSVTLYFSVGLKIMAYKKYGILMTGTTWRIMGTMAHYRKLQLFCLAHCRLNLCLLSSRSFTLLFAGLSKFSTHLCHKLTCFNLF